MLLCDKPAGITSHDMVRQVRRERGCKAGHAGTLDPFATGLLLVLLGRATRLQRFLTGLPKTYRGDGAARLALEHRRPRRRADRDRAAAGVAGAADRHGAPARADDLGRAGRRRAALPQGPPGRNRRDPANARSRSTAPSCSSSDAESAELRDRVLQPAPTSAPWSRPSATPTAPSCAAPRSAPSGSRTRAKSSSWSGSPSWSRPRRRPCDER